MTTGNGAEQAALAAEAGRVLPRIARLLAPYRGPLALVALAVVVSAALTSIAPFLTRAVFDRALFPPGGVPTCGCCCGW